MRDLLGLVGEELFGGRSRPALSAIGIKGGEAMDQLFLIALNSNPLLLLLNFFCWYVCVIGNNAIHTLRMVSGPERMKVSFDS